MSKVLREPAEMLCELREIKAHTSASMDKVYTIKIVTDRAPNELFFIASDQLVKVKIWEE